MKSKSREVITLQQESSEVRENKLKDAIVVLQKKLKDSSNVQVT